MTIGNLQYISDSLIIESLIENDLFYKKADIGGFLSGAIGSIMSWAKGHVDTSDTKSILTSLANIMAPAVLFKINPLFGILADFAHFLGFDVMDIIKPIFLFIKEKLNSQESFTPSDISSVGVNALSSAAGSIDSNEVVAFEELNGILKNSQKNSLPSIPFFGGDKNTSIIGNIFGNLFKTQATGKAKWLLGGFVIWLIKTVLLGAGLMAGGEAIAKLFGKSPNPSHPGKSYSTSENYNQPSNIHTNIKLQPSGRGEEQHKNDGESSLWIVPVINDSIENTLVAWAKDIYPELEGKENIILANPSFNKTVDEIRQDHESDGNQLTIPTKFKSRKQVVDQFVGDIVK